MARDVGIGGVPRGCVRGLEVALDDDVRLGSVVSAVDALSSGARERLPAGDCDTRVDGVELDGGAAPAGWLRRDDGGARAHERVEHEIPRPAGVLERPLDELEGLHGGMERGVGRAVDAPRCPKQATAGGSAAEPFSAGTNRTKVLPVAPRDRERLVERRGKHVLLNDGPSVVPDLTKRGK